ncbi:MAG: NAD-dependent epimerase/dehydratase family protein [Saprospiraceae bacterium]
MIEKNDKILVTGGSGFVGSYILSYLVSYGYTDIITITRNKENIILPENIKAKIKIKEGDILDVVFLEDIISQCKYIIHAAALVSFKPKDKNSMMKTNIDGTANVVNLSLDHNIKKLIFISSIASLGRTPGTDMYNENAQWEDNDINSDYANSKYGAELEVWRGIVEGLNGAIINPSMILGAGVWNNGTGEFFSMIYKGLRFYPTGSNGFVDVRDVANMSIKLLESDISDERFICSGENIKFKDLLMMIANELKTKPPTIKIKSGIVKSISFFIDIFNFISRGNSNLTSQSIRNISIDSKYDNSKSIKALNYKYIPIEKTIAETAQCFLNSKKNGTKYGLLEIKKGDS